MAVLLKVEQNFPDGSMHIVPRLYPTGRAFTRDERERAEALDSFLGRRMPEIGKELGALGLLKASALQKWHALGQRLTFVEDPTLVSLQDKEMGVVWLAIRQNAESSLLPRGEKPLTPARMAATLDDISSHRRLGKKHDHFERCYKLGKLSLEDVGWLTWSDFDAFLESPGLERDPRILRIVGQNVAQMERGLNRQEIRALFKRLREAIPTKGQHRDTNLLSEGQIEDLVARAFSEAGLR